ncbi:MAG: peptidylprolyl isomerase [Planctomycetota bacterium]|jgi:cyclophilin family peptidyl-prolyl cis-trans isomerase
MTPWARGTSTSAILLLAAAAPVAAQDEPKPQEVPALAVPAGEAATLDGRIGNDEWKDGVDFEVKRGDEVFGTGHLKRYGRQLFVAYRSELPPWALGVRLNFMDPVSQHSIPVLVTPLNPPRPPLAAFRQPPGREPEAVSCVSGDVRFAFPEGKFTMELRLPMDLLEFSRSAKSYRFNVELWDLEANRTIGLYPHALSGLGGGQKMVRFEPTDTWGADTPLESEPATEHLGLKLLEEAGRDAGTLRDFSGWYNGRRTDAPLAELEERLRQAIAAYPDYISLRANLVQVSAARNDLEGALAALDRLGEDFPQIATTVRHLLIRMEFLRNLSRYEEAVAHLDRHAEALQGDPRADVERPMARHMLAAWRAEQEIRRREAERDDLPRVRVKTNKGEIVLELFEDDVPNAVANFISLVERGVYDGTRFFWAEGGRRILGGDPNSRDEDPHNDGFGDPGYLIESEPGRRLNFGFMVAFADKRRERRTEGASFVIHMSPLPAIDGRNTVFGRVIEGHDTVRKLEYYDVLVEAKVVRKRDHEYEPVKRP